MSDDGRRVAFLDRACWWAVGGLVLLAALGGLAYALRLIAAAFGA